jgi:hypothetical protein
MAEHRFVAHDQSGDIGIAVGQLKRNRNLPFISSVVLVDPNTERNV